MVWPYSRNRRTFQVTYAEQGAAPIMEMLASEIAEERIRKAAVEAKAAATATSAATLGASIIALAGLLYASQFQYTGLREVALAVILILFSAALTCSLIVLYMGGYPNVSVKDIRELKSNQWEHDAMAGAGAIFAKYADFLGEFGIKNDERAGRLRVAIGLQIGGTAATVLAGVLLAVKAI